jgi:hypothetical protein
MRQRSIMARQTPALPGPGDSPPDLPGDMLPGIPGGGHRPAPPCKPEVRLRHPPVPTPMPERNIHQEAVTAWRKGWAGTLAQPALLDLFERALDALWRRANMSLGEMTLMAIVDRVLHQGCEQFPHLAQLKVETNGVHFGALRHSVQGLDREQLEESLVFLVYELMRVFGSLTGEILTPGLHAQLHTVRASSVASQGGKP